MKRRLFLLLMSVASSPLIFGAGIVTPFIHVDMGVIAQGKPVIVHGPGGDGLLLFNKEDQAVHIQMKAAVPLKKNLQRGLEAIPDIAWIHFEPEDATLLPHQHMLIKMAVEIPANKEFHEHTYEALILTRIASKDSSRVEVVGALQSRLQFHVE